MAVVKIVDQTNKEVGEITLAPEVFEVEIRPEIMHQEVRRHLAGLRAGTHATRNRAKMTGGGRKPWRQKGTGRARAGTIRSPLWRGGATIFGPQPRDYSFKLNKKVKRLALKMALSAKLAEAGLTVVNTIDLPEIKTRNFAKVVSDLGLKKALIVCKDPDNTLLLSARNVPWVKLIEADKVSAYEVLRYPQLIVLEGAAQRLEERLK